MLIMVGRGLYKQPVYREDCLLSFLLLLLFFISWRLITLQYCSGFCHTLTWISLGYTCISPSWSPLPPPSPPDPSGSSQVYFRFYFSLLWEKKWKDAGVLEAPEKTNYSFQELGCSHGHESPLLRWWWLIAV